MKIFTFFLFAMPLLCWSHNFLSSEREYDSYGRLTIDKFLNGKSVEISYDKLNRVTGISLGETGKISYKYDDSHLLQVSRISPSGQIMYTHAYEYDDAGGLSHEELISNLGQISYDKDVNGRFIRIESPYSQEICGLNPQGLITTHVVNEKTLEYHYDNQDQLISSGTEDKTPVLEYDCDGNLTKKISANGRYYLEFDQYGKLVEVITDKYNVTYTYDDLDRRIAKKIRQKGKEETETYLYFGNNEIATYGEDGALKHLRVPGLSSDDNFILPIAIETKDEVYATIHDYQGNISKLVNTENQEIISIPHIDPFGQNLDRVTSSIPWLFASKHYDAETHLVYFGNRYYDPELKHWITPDPLGTLQHSNVYLYCLGNPLLYCDPDGKFAIPLVSLAWGAGALFTFPVWGTAALVTVTGAAVGWATYEVIQKVKEGKQRDGTPKTNGAQNAQYEDAVREIERKIGKRLDGRDRDKLHDHITGQDYGYHEIIEEGYWLFK